MFGRYGPDELYNFLFKIYIGLLIIDLFIKFDVLLYLELFLIIVILYRFFSKDISRRREENKSFLKIKANVTKPFKEWSKHIKDKNNIYKKCHKCKTVLRLPVPDRKGFKHVKCPKCKNRLTVFCFKSERIEVIKTSRSRGGVKKDV